MPHRGGAVTARSVILVRAADGTEGTCAACPAGITAGQRAALVLAGRSHSWLHVACLTRWIVTGARDGLILPDDDEPGDDLQG